MSGGAGGWKVRTGSFGPMRKTRQVLLLLGGNEHDPRVTLAKAAEMVVDRLGSPAGHFELEPRDVTNANAAHDNLFGDNNGVRNSPFHGWIVQTIRPGGFIGANPPSIPAGLTGQWARTLAQSVTSHTPAGTDVG